MIKPFIPKDHKDLPDFYTITVYYNDGKSEQIEAVHHGYTNMKDLGILRLEILTHSDTWEVISVDYIRKLSFDLAYTKLLDIARKVGKEDTPI